MKCVVYSKYLNKYILVLKHLYCANIQYCLCFIVLYCAVLC